MRTPAGRAWPVLRAVGAFTLTAAMLGGVPYALAVFTGWPRPRRVPAWAGIQVFLTSPLTNDAIIKALACLVWLLWLTFTLSVIMEVAAVARGSHAPRPPVIAPVQGFAAALVSAVLLTSVPLPQPAPRAGLHAVLAARAMAAPLLPDDPAPAAPAAILAAAQDPGGRDLAASGHAAKRPRVYRVAEGDNLWDIAARFLGDGERWHELYDLNRGKPQPDGGRLTEPDLIYPGWVLALPARPAPPAGHHPSAGPRPAQAAGSRDAPVTVPPVYRVVPGDDLWKIAAQFLGNGERWHELYHLNAGKPQPDGRTLTDPSLIYPGWILLLAPPGGHNGSRPPHHDRRPAPARTPSPSPSRTRPREGSSSTPSPAPARTHPASRPVAVHLPSGALIGISVAIMVAAALTLASIQRRRRYRPRADSPGSLQPGEPPLPAVITALRRAARPAPPSSTDDDAGPDSSTPPVLDPYLDPYDDTSSGPGQHGDAVPGSRPAPQPETPGPARTSPPAGAGAPPAREPGPIPLGVRGTSEAALDIA
ncbi:MAG TPA: LysM peptidoglycan-binding domain-containing protein, partial [Streptosporangiaceae bacterium]